jgi:serine/threonine protein kinase
MANLKPQEMRAQGQQAAFSQKSDIYAFSCILYRLCSLAEPMAMDDIKPMDILTNYSIELLSLISNMLSSDRDVRPTASQTKYRLAAMALKLFQLKTATCRTCEQTFPSRNQLVKHLKNTGHNRKATVEEWAPLLAISELEKENGFRFRGCANAPAQYHYDNEDLGVLNPSPCMVCNKYFNTKRQFFAHLSGVHHFRNTKYVLKRKAEKDLTVI